jgi:hypothetical protein
MNKGSELVTHPRPIYSSPQIADALNYSPAADNITGRIRFQDAVDTRQRKLVELTLGHFLGHVQNKLAVSLVGFAQHPAQLV